MKRSTTAIVFLTLTLFIVSCAGCNHNSRYLSVSESDTEYSFSVEYSKAKTRELQQFINDCIKPNRLEGKYIDVNTTLNDRTQFYMKSTAGRLFIKIDKTQNSEASYRRIKEMCRGIREILND